jgi:hypothetical protein
MAPPRRPCPWPWRRRRARAWHPGSWPRRLRPWWRLRPAALRAQAFALPRLAGFSGPWLLLAHDDTAVQADAGTSVVEIELPIPGANERLALWRALAPAPLSARTASAADGAAANLDPIRDSRCSLAVLLRAARLAASTPAGDAGATMSPAQALHAGTRAAARELGAWAQISHDRVPLDAWVGQSEI